MHDPMTVAFEIRYPWRQWRYRHSPSAFLRTYHAPIITVWHKDPERGGDDDSCDWFWRRFPTRQQAELDDLVTNPDDNIRYWFIGTSAEHDEDEMKRFVQIVAAHARRVTQRRPWWQVPRHHIWHWRVQVHPGQRAYRWLFVRCATCGGRFGWNESPCALAWHHDRSDVHHMRCVGVEVAQTAEQPEVAG